MRKVVVSVWDSAMQAYAVPVFVPARGVAIRSFMDTVNATGQEASQLSVHPEDFELRILAEFDEETGVFHFPAEGVGAVILRGKEAVSREQ